MKIAWVTTWSRVCGIADYSQTLWPSIQHEIREAGGEAVLVSLDEFKKGPELGDRLRSISPDLVHFQHEYGIFGGKNPPFYRFPGWIQEFKKALPRTRWVATAHTVLSPEYRFPVQGRGWQAPLRAMANRFVLKKLSRAWGEGTWGAMNGVIVHSRHQKDWIRGPDVGVIPHFVPSLSVKGTVPRAMGGAKAPVASEQKILLVFGFFTPEKGQDVAIRALAELPKTVRLVCAGGVRRPSDQKYLDRCWALAEELGVKDRVEVTGYVDRRMIDSYYSRADLVLVPFRETSGSGSIAQAFARGAPILASDLLLNREINERVSGAVELFKSEDPKDCARQVQALLGDGTRLSGLKETSRLYAEACSPRNIAREHLEFYRRILKVAGK